MSSSADKLDVGRLLLLPTPSSGSTSLTNALRVAESGKRSLADQIDILLLKLLSLERELKTVQEQKVYSANKLAECLRQTELLRGELAEKSRETAALVEKLEAAHSETAKLKRTIAKFDDDYGQQLENCNIPILSSLTDSVRDLGREHRSIVLRDKSQMVEELEFAVHDAVGTKAELYRSQKRLRKYEEIIHSSLKNCKVFVDAFDLSVDPTLSLGEFVAQMTQSVQAQWLLKDDELKRKDSTLDEIRQELQQSTAELKAQIEDRKQSLQRYELIPFRLLEVNDLIRAK